MTEAALIVENAALRDEVRDLRMRLEACNLILAKNVEELMTRAQDKHWVESQKRWNKWEADE